MAMHSARVSISSPELRSQKLALLESTWTSQLMLYEQSQEPVELRDLPLSDGQVGAAASVVVVVVLELVVVVVVVGV